MIRVTDPADINASFARVRNGGNLDDLLSFYETDAILQTGPDQPPLIGHEAIRTGLQGLIAVPGTMVSLTNFCLVQGDLAMLRADWTITAPGGAAIAAASTAELARRQPDGRWLYVIDHAVGASLPRVG